jgi:hypothetical protein
MRKTGRKTVQHDTTLIIKQEKQNKFLTTLKLAGDLQLSLQAQGTDTRWNNYTTTQKNETVNKRSSKQLLLPDSNLKKHY